MTKTAAIIIIGNEILSGKVVDKNSPYLTKELRALGVDVRKILVIPDEESVIADEIARTWPHYDWVFTTGGIGPTHDDVTINGIAQGLKREVLRDQGIEDYLRERFGSRFNDAVLKLADVPAGAQSIRAENLKYPVLRVENIFIFPGIPEITRRKFDAIKEMFKEKPFFIKKILLNLREEEIANSLSEVLIKYPQLLLGSYPVSIQPEFKVILTLESKDAEYLEAAFTHLISQLPSDKIFKTE